MTTGSYSGDLIVKFLDDGRRVELVKAFAYTDPSGELWKVPPKATVDGASIPRVLWTVIGGPFTDKYRNASVIHDWYCDRRSRPWQAVHRVFYNAMITSGVSEAQAKLLYSGVYWGGPRWSKTVVQNAQLPQPRDTSLGFGGSGLHAGFMVGGGSPFNNGFGGAGGSRTRTTVRRYELPLSKASYDQLAEDVRARDLALDEIETLVDQRTAGLPQQPPSRGLKP